MSTHNDNTNSHIPYYAVIFTNTRTDVEQGYEEMADKMIELAALQDGFLGVESARSEIGITVSYWKDLESIAKWKSNAEHTIARDLGRNEWYKQFTTRIAKVEREYSFEKKTNHRFFMLKNLYENHKLTSLILVAIFLRLLAAYILTDKFQTNEAWEYGAIAESIAAGDGFSLAYFENDSLKYEYKENIKAFPSAYMPPAYPILLRPIYLISSEQIQNFSIITINILLNVFTMLLLFRLSKLYFDESTALVALLIYALLPEFIYASVRVGTTAVYHFFVIAIIYWLSKIENLDLKSAAKLGLIFGLFTLFRSEAVIFLALILFYQVLKYKKFKESILAFSILLICLIPWQFRNYMVFDKFIPLTTSTGLNLYRGHNPYYQGSWGDSLIEAKRLENRNNPHFELAMNQVYIDEIFKFWQKEAHKEITLSIEKLTSLILINPKDKRAFSLIYIIPWILILTFSAFSLFKTRNKHKFAYTYLFIAFSFSLALLTFVIPRYQTMFKIILIPFSAYTLVLVWQKLRSTFLKSGENNNVKLP